MSNRLLILCLLLFSLAATVRIAYAWKMKIHLDGVRDQEMEMAAGSLVNTGTFGNVYSENSGPSAHVEPLYALLLASIYAIWGAMTPHAYIVQSLVSIAITATGIALLPLLAMRIQFFTVAGVLAGIFLALAPLNLWQETAGSWEEPIAVLFLMGLLFSVMALHDSHWQSKRALISFCVLMGSVSLLSPVIFAVGLLMLLAEWGRHLRNKILYPVLKGTFAVGLTVAAFLSPWIWRNYRDLGGFVPFRSNGGLELWVGNNPTANGRSFTFGYKDPRSRLYHLHPKDNPAELAEYRAVGELPYMKHKGAQARQWITDHPMRFLQLTATRFALFWFPPANLWDEGQSARWFRSAAFCGISVGMFAGLWMMFQHRRRYRWIWLMVTIGYSLPYMITHVNMRYRYPILALSALLACQAAFWLLQRIYLGYLYRNFTYPQFEHPKAWEEG